MILNNFKKIHFIGVDGIGISAIAKMMLKEGKNVSDSDIAESEISKELEGLGQRFIPRTRINSVRGRLAIERKT